MNGHSSADNTDLEAYLSQLTPSERAEALAAAAAAQRAEERAEQRALERALREKEEQRRSQPPQHSAVLRNDAGISSEQRLVYIPKRKREQISTNAIKNEPSPAEKALTLGAVNGGSNGSNLQDSRRIASGASTVNGTTSGKPSLTEKERLTVIQTYLGKSATEVVQQEEEANMRKRKQNKSNKKATFKFRWDETDDTSNLDDPIYAPLHLDPAGRMRPPTLKLQKIMGTREVSSMASVMQKSIDQMTARDWRILRENYEISVRGGQAPPPMRFFAESPSAHLPQLHPSILDAIENVLRFKEPSPIQRQAIPIGLQRRDLIGISETGSGKTVAFGVPICHYLLNLPKEVLGSVADQGPLALVMAPTRELALQIEVELSKLLSRQRIIQSIAVVGGQPIQQQAQLIRRGVHIIVGTPGRINECIEMAYLVLNQCCYIVMDEADRMIDMGFAPQMESM
jgi:DEAD/DEAH box helicase